MPLMADSLFAPAVKPIYFTAYSIDSYYMNTCFVCKNLCAMKIFHSYGSGLFYSITEYPYIFYPKHYAVSSQTKGPPAGTEKTIDFDRVREFYDLYVCTTADVGFWKRVAGDSQPPLLELMAGTGRITLPLLEAGHLVEGLDYSAGLLEVLERKLGAAGIEAPLHHADARDFDLGRKFGLIFIGFQSISEVVDDDDKIKVFGNVRRHLAPGASFWVTIHNPPARRGMVDGRDVDLGTYRLASTGEDVTVSGRYLLDEGTGIVSGKQTYRCLRGRRESRLVELPMRFHLVSPQRLVELLSDSGFDAAERLGDYDGSAFEPSRSPFFLVRCRAR
jgi:SAM-dependent methyltransferase